MSVIAIGALGGSGTRAVAQVLIDSGIYMGRDLNSPKDNLWFTRLFKNPKWYQSATESMIRDRLKIFEKLMESRPLSLQEKQQLCRAALRNPTYRSRISFYWKVMANRLHQPGSSERWGWKEPNTQIYVKEIGSYFADIRYVHVIRHGLDMAFSKNQQQLNNWGFLHGIDVNRKDTEEVIARKQLEYWLASNRATIAAGEEALGDRFYLLNHQKFVSNPRIEIRRLLDYLEIDVSHSTFEDLTQLPKITPSDLRYKGRDISIFSEEQLEGVRELGFDV